MKVNKNARVGHITYFPNKEWCAKRQTRPNWQSFCTYILLTELKEERISGAAQRRQFQHAGGNDNKRAQRANQRDRSCNGRQQLLRRGRWQPLPCDARGQDCVQQTMIARVGQRRRRRQRRRQRRGSFPDIPNDEVNCNRDGDVAEEEDGNTSRGGCDSRNHDKDTDQYDGDDDDEGECGDKKKSSRG